MTDTLLKTHPELAWQETPGADPYIALESLDDAAVDTWVTAQNTRTTGAFGKTPETDALTARLKAAYTSQERIVSCSRYADWGYNTWQDDTHPLGIVRRTPWAAWLAGKPEWQTILDVDTLDLNQKAGDATRWALHDFDMLYPTWDRALVSLSPGGSDACMVREFDVESRTFVEDGFTLPDVGKHGISWIDRDTVYVGWDDSARSKKPALTTSGFPRQARKWTRGTALADAPVVFEGTRRDVSAGVDYDPLENLHLASRAVTFFETLQYWLDESTGEWQQYDVPLHAELENWNGWLFVTPREDYAVGARRYASGALLVIRRDAFLGGARDFTVLFKPSGRNVLADIDFTKHWLLLSRMDDGSPRVDLLAPPPEGENAWTRRDFKLPAGSQSDVGSIDSEHDDTVLIYTEHFLSPPSLYFADLAVSVSESDWQLLARLPAQFDATGLIAERRHAVAPDGVAIPYWLIGREANVKGERAAPCLLYGYGGFEVALDPHYDATSGIAWLESGGLYVVANIRGGGEFGPDWHQAAQREKRHVAFNDFYAVAEALIATGVTTSKELAIRGGSNGGLLTGVALVERPELFGAVLSEVPLLDMARFHLLLQGASWIDEYGDPEDKADLAFLMTYSPYQNVKAGVTYPPSLFTSSATDDRVHPGHARKMAARMQALGHDNVWYLENRDGGHGAGVEADSIARVEATAFTYLRAMIG